MSTLLATVRIITSMGLFFLLCLGPFHLASAASYYVSPAGNDTNPGTIDLPWKTVQMATRTLGPGDTALLRGGTYPESRITFSQSGTETAPITLAAYPGETPVIDGGFSSPPGGAIPIFEIQGVHYITLAGLTIRRGAIMNIRIAYDHPATHITIRQCDIKEFVYTDNSANIYIGVSGADDISIERNKLHDGQGVPTSYSNAAGIIIFRAKKLTIRNNEIYNTGNGIYYKHSNDDGFITMIENNLIHGQSSSLADRGIKISRSDARILSNTIHAYYIGIEVFEESADCASLVSARNQIIHNTVVNTTIGISLARSSRCEGAIDTTLQDNLVFAQKSSLVVWKYFSGADGSRTTFRYNLLYSATLTKPIEVINQFYATSSLPPSFIGTSAGSLQSLPQFRDETSHDYTLIETSPGKRSASDGNDMGSNPCLAGTATCLPSPVNLTLVTH